MRYVGRLGEVLTVTLLTGILSYFETIVIIKYSMKKTALSTQILRKIKNHLHNWNYTHKPDRIYE